MKDLKSENERPSPLEGLGMSVMHCLTMGTPRRYAIYRNAAEGSDAGRFHLVAALGSAPTRMAVGPGWDTSQDYQIVGYLDPPTSGTLDVSRGAR